MREVNMLNVYLMKYLAVGAIALMIGMAIYDYGHNKGYKEKEVELLSCQNTVLTMERAATMATTESYIKRDQAIQQHETRENELKTDIDMLAAANQRLLDSQRKNSVQRTSTSTETGKTARASSCMSAELLSGCIQTIGGLSEIAGFADASRNAGLTCEAVR